VPPPRKYLVIADAGYGSFKLVVAGFKMGLWIICNAKQSHGGYPKAVLA
jgi:hypothetical protein